VARVPGPKIKKEFGVVIEWDEAEVDLYLANPNGPLGAGLMHALGEIVAEGAKKRALRRQGAPTDPRGHMADLMTFQVGEDEISVYTDVYSPATDPRSHNFPYPLVHEGKKVRDRRAHRSLRPALRDIRNIETGRL
jgi:hypothetical protein